MTKRSQGTPPTPAEEEQLAMQLVEQSQMRMELHNSIIKSVMADPVVSPCCAIDNVLNAIASACIHHAGLSKENFIEMAAKAYQFENELYQVQQDGVRDD